MKSVEKSTFTYFFGTIILAILSFIISLLYSQFFSPSDFGIYSIVFSTYTLISQFFSGWVTQALLRFYSSNTEKKMMSSVLIMHVLFSIVEVLVVNVAIFATNIQFIQKEMYAIFTIIFFFEQFLLIINTLFRAKKNSKQYTINTNLNSILKIVSLLLLYFVFGIKHIVVIVFSLLISEIIQTIYLFIKYKLYIYFDIKNLDLSFLIKMFKYGFPLIGVSITSWILNVSDRYIIEYFYDSNAVGLYSYSYTLANNIITLIMQFIMLGAFPHIISVWEKHGKAKTEEVISDYLFLYYIIVVPVIIGVIFMGKSFIYMFTNSEYHSTYLNFIITCIGIFILGISQYSNKAWELNKKTGMILLLNVLAAAINIFLNILFVPKYGYIVGSITTLISYVLYLIISLILGKKYVSVAISLNNKLKLLVSIFIEISCILFVQHIIAINSIITFLIAVVIVILLYLLSLILLKVFDINEIKKMRRGKW